MIEVEGKAVLVAPNGERFVVEPEDLDWQQTGGSERGMGAELVHTADVEYQTETGGTVRCVWSVYEYPVGAFNTHQTEPVGGSLDQDFSSFSISSEDD